MGEMSYIAGIAHGWYGVLHGENECNDPSYKRFRPYLDHPSTIIVCLRVCRKTCLNSSLIA